MDYPDFQVPLYLEYLAAFTWAASGTIVGIRKGYDPIGVFIVALLSSFGGSLLRDGLFLHRTPVMVTNATYLPLVLVTTLLVAIVMRRRMRHPIIARAATAVDVIDAIGTPAFVVIGMQLSMAAGIPLPGVLLIGAINGVGGGLLRDILVGDTPSVLQPGYYAASLVVVASVFYLLLNLVPGIGSTVSAWSMIGLFFVLRMATLRMKWRTRPLVP